MFLNALNSLFGTFCVQNNSTYFLAEQIRFQWRPFPESIFHKFISFLDVGVKNMSEHRTYRAGYCSNALCVLDVILLYSIKRGHS